MNKLKTRRVVTRVLTQNMPLQHRILGLLLQKFSEIDYVAQIFVRGSLAGSSRCRGQEGPAVSGFDRNSDVDVVLVVDPKQFATLLSVIDIIMLESFGAIMPGWFDKIVPNFGGVGLVYILAIDGRLIQADIYITPEISKTFGSLKEKRLLYQRTTPVKRLAKSFDISKKIDAFAIERDTASGDFIAGVILAFLINKRQTRRQFFLGFKEMGMLYDVIGRILRRRYDPTMINYGWYGFSLRVATCQRGHDFVVRLKDLMDSGRVDSPATLGAVFQLLTEVMAQCFPVEHAELSDAVEMLAEYFRAYSLGFC